MIPNCQSFQSEIRCETSRTIGHIIPRRQLESCRDIEGKLRNVNPLVLEYRRVESMEGDKARYRDVVRRHRVIR